MCDICLKYKCPDGCPNNYKPRGESRKNNEITPMWSFTVLLELDVDESYPAYNKAEEQY